MKYDRMDVAVGFVVLGAIVVAALSTVWLTPKMKAADGAAIYTDVSQLDGLSAQNTPVFMKGYQIGRVENIQPRITKNGALIFRLRLFIDRWTTDDGDRLPLNEGLRARIVPPPIAVFGSGMVSLEQVGPVGKPLVADAVIPSASATALVDQVQQLTDSLQREVRSTMASARVLLASADRAVAEAANTARSANDVALVTKQQLPTLFNALNTELALVDTTIRRVNAVSPVAIAALDSVQRLVGDSRATMARLNGLVDRHEPQVMSVIANLDTTSVLLQNFMRKLSEKPLRALTGISVPKDLERAPVVRQAGAPKP